MKKVLFFLLAFTSSAFGQYTQMQWGMNKTVTPYTYGLNMSGVWYDFATVTLRTRLDGTKIFTFTTPNYQAINWGITTSSADNVAAFNQAIEDISALGGGTLELPAGEFTTGTVTLRDNVYIKGGGQNNTTIKLKNGTNSDLFYTLNAYALFGTNSTGGVTNFGLTDLTLDGNRSNNTAGNCLTVYGYKYLLENLTIKNCPQNGIRTEWSQYGDLGMESYYGNLLIDTTGEYGIIMDGPHDSEFNSVMVIDASQKVNSGYDALYIGPHGNGRFYNYHGWHRSTTTNRARYQAYVNTFGANFTGSHFEGSNLAGLAIAAGAGKNSFDATNMYYSPWVNGQPSVVIGGNNNIVKGHILGSLDGSKTVKGVELFGTAAGNNIELMITGSQLGAVDFSGSGGLNVLNVIAAQDGTGPGYIGTPPASDTVNLDVFNAASLGSLHVNANALTQFRKDQDAATAVRIANYGVGASTEARLEQFTGTPNSVCYSSLVDFAGNPYYNFSCGAAVTYSRWQVPLYFTAATYFNSALNVKGSGAGYTNVVSANAGASNYIATLPANTGTIAETNLAQSFTANQTFGSTNLQVQGTSTGVTTIGTANAGATNYTATLPANTGTIGETNLAQTWTAKQTFDSYIKLKSFTVGALPSCTAGLEGDVAYVTDANAPTYNAPLAGGGAVRVIAFCNGSNWTAH